MIIKGLYKALSIGRAYVSNLLVVALLLTSISFPAYADEAISLDSISEVEDVELIDTVSTNEAEDSAIEDMDVFDVEEDFFSIEENLDSDISENAVSDNDLVVSVSDDNVSADEIVSYVSADEIVSEGIAGYTITYVLNDSAVSRADNSANLPVTDGVRYELKSPKRNGYIFDGWYENSGYTQRIKEIPTTNVGRSITVYAKWTPKKYKIKYKIKKAKNSKSNSKFYTIESNFKLKKPKINNKKLYVFDGWYLDSKYTKKVTSIKPGMTGNITLYAKVRKKSYTLQFIVDGKVVKSTSVPIDKTYTLPGTDIVKKLGCNLNGWYVNKSGKGKNYKPGSSVKKLSGKDKAIIKLYGVWTVKPEYKNAYDVVDLVNKERKNHGLTPYATNDILTLCAMARAKEIATKFSHVRPNGKWSFSIVTEKGYAYRYIGENIAYGQKNPSKVMESWMRSEGHRENILDDNFKEIGVGCFEKDGVKYWVQIFGTRMGY